MLRKHLVAVAAIAHSPSLNYRVRRYFNLGSGSLHHEMRAAGLNQSDLVLALMRIGTRRSRSIVEALIGKPITYGPACRFVYSFNKQNPTLARQPVITWVIEKPPLRKSTRLGDTFCEFQVGRTRDQLRMRGVSNGDIRRALSRGWIRMAGV